MQKRILMAVNLLLLGVCGWCIYLLATTRYEQPQEIAEVNREIAETRYIPSPTGTILETSYARTGPNLSNINKPYMNALFTPTPTPTPSPTPTPLPPNLAQAIQTWTITSLDTKSVDIHDTKTNSDFTLELGGPSHPASDMRGMVLEVKLESVDLNELKAMFTALNQHAPKEFK